MSKAKQLKTMLNSENLEFILEAHNGLSARVVEEAGFSGIWASGLALSAQFGVRDNNEASWTQIVDMVEFMSDVTSIPILLDGDTGYGNFNNMRRLVQKLEQRDVAGVCIEDKIFPKTNSFIRGEEQPLADIDEFCGKIAAGKDSQQDDDFVIVARVEALIAGRDVSEAIRRADAYHRAGADAILIHSKLSKADQIVEFANEWANRAPLVIVPTKYYSTPVSVYENAQIALVIWANHMVRSAIGAMQETAGRIFAERSLVAVEDDIATVDEIFRLQGADELAAAERRYFTASRDAGTAVILAASRGDELADFTDERPKVMVPVNGKPLLTRTRERLRKQGIHSITAVAGYRADAIDVEGVEVIVNADYAHTGEVASLNAAAQSFSQDMVIMYGDVLFRSYILRGLLESESEITIAVDSQWQDTEITGAPDFAFCSSSDDRTLWRQDAELLELTDDPNGGAQPHGRWIGMMRVRGAGLTWLNAGMETLKESQVFHSASLADLLNTLVRAGHPIRVIYIHGHWLDINSVADLERAGLFAAGK
ncbi:MAG: phosphoenolpyruvate mutase [Pseudomonadota bacterium]